MHSTIARFLLCGYWANIVYIIGMIGYLIIDTISYMYMSFNSTISSIIYMILASVFVIDAILYTMDWYMYAVKLRKYQDQPVQYRSEFVACIFQNLGSIFYLIGAILVFEKIQVIEKKFLFNLFGIISFLMESFLTLLGWIIVFRRRPAKTSKNSCNFQNAYIWAHVLNIIGNLIYLCATILAYYIYRTEKIINSSRVLLLQIFGDFVYLFDAYIYHECWKQDKQELYTITENQSLNKFYLEKPDHQNKSNENK
ncbi:unnamed protein product [Rotaria socialis]|uniref:Transmembrane protein n=1 Tax=Rotaria socialis TaxID=392032 RepID=A0A817SQD5_9BILA|nr:unnamed protein product [Rotaria socialis]CAF3298033.1 unnamed protein product [Rotaria socialis]CAF3470628.1 unnamed protein product [Rotaria socialis]CAF4168959.1 unnamed protein product [Rotaria socialis]CAF4218430.1 unnamed protein product [Rotaria socialis]